MTEARIYSQGYRGYAGERTGLAGAVRSLVKQSLRESFGLGKPFRHKLLPVGTTLLAYLPAVAFIGFAAILPVGAEAFLPSYPEYYGLVSAALFLLCGTITPALLCSDRRTGMLGLYLASPLTRLSYLVGKGIAVLVMMLGVTLGPPLLMLIAFTLQDVGPDSVGQWMGTLWRVGVAAVVVGLPFSLVSMAVSAMTDRRAVASASTMALIAGSAPFTEILVAEVDLSPLLRLGNILFLPQALSFRIFGEPGGWPQSDNPTWTLWVAWAAWCAGSISLVWYRYQRLEVTR